MPAATATQADPYRRVTPTLRSVPPVSGRPLAADAHDPLAQSMHLMGAAISYPRNAEIYGDNEAADYLYKVISGTVRTYKVLSDGRRQIGGFYLPGEIFGLEVADEHTLSAEAMTDAKVLVIKRSALEALAARDSSVARELFALTRNELRRVQERILLLIKSAQERVASFLLEMASRATTGNAIDLPMSRQDIADYLGLTIETVSRTLTSLESSAAIEVPTSRHIVLRNPVALRRMNG
jgi:CRP/FNR family nitrogen fixation transcriptional regulator